MTLRDRIELWSLRREQRQAKREQELAELRARRRAQIAQLRVDAMVAAESARLRAERIASVEERAV